MRESDRYSNFNMDDFLDKKENNLYEVLKPT
jgi:hypothetical protein